MKRIFSILFLILFIVSLLVTTIRRFDEISVPYFKGIRKSVQVDVIYKNKITKVFHDNKVFEKSIKINDKHYLYGCEKFILINKISFEDINSIEKINLYQGNTVKEYKTIPKEIKINNNKNIFEKITIIFLSFFYNYKLYLLSYLFLILFLSFSNFKIKLNSNLAIVLITFLALFLRIVQLNEIPFWDDEVYVLVHTSLNAKLSELFTDPGNPPLYFIIFKLWRIIIQNENLYRLLAVVTGLIFNFAFFEYIKTWLKTKRALFGYFIVAISLILIYFSQELRCYMFLMLFSILSSILLFKFKSKKNQILYFINLICLLNTHFYGIFLAFYNLIFGSFIYYKKKKIFKRFILVNILSFLIFIPNVILKMSSVTSDFNTWIGKPRLYEFSELFKNFTVIPFGFVVFLLIILIFLKKSKNNKEKLFLSYNFSALISVIIFSFIFSYLIKPVFLYRYFYVIHPQYLALCVYLICYNFKTVYKYLMQFILFLIFITTGRLNTQNLYNNSYLYFNFVKQDIDNSKNNYVFFTNTVQNYSLFEDELSKKAKLIYLPVNRKGFDDITPDDYDIKKPCTCYILNLYLKPEVYQKTNLIEIYKTNLGVISKIEYK